MTSNEYILEPLDPFEISFSKDKCTNSNSKALQASPPTTAPGSHNKNYILIKDYSDTEEQPSARKKVNSSYHPQSSKKGYSTDRFDPPVSRNSSYLAPTVTPFTLHNIPKYNNSAMLNGASQNHPISSALQSPVKAYRSSSNASKPAPVSYFSTGKPKDSNRIFVMDKGSTRKSISNNLIVPVTIEPAEKGEIHRLNMLLNRINVQLQNSSRYLAKKWR